jgi:signal transduction histidine kinase
LAKDALRGVITLARRDPFLPDDVRAMNDLAPLVATALENVALYASVRAEQASRLRVLQTISHEIKSPLHTLNGYLDLALSGMGGPVDERQGMLLQRARASGERLAAQVKDLLLVAYEEVGELPMQMTPVDLRRVLLSALEAVEIVAHEAGVALHANLPPTLPPLLADGERLGQVARNLLNNAIAHTPHGGHVTLQASVCLGAVEWSVSDTGCGIATEHLPHIFERFYRVPATSGTARSQGQGLGLAIVKTIVERHGGRVQVASTPNVGSRFTVALPMQRAAPPEAPAAATGAASVG